MLFIEQSIPSYLTLKQNLTRTVLFTAVFALAFINFYSPFGVDVWLHASKLQLFFYSSMVILTGMLVVALSRIIMYHFSRKKKITYFAYAIWVLIEILSMAAFYSLFGLYVLNKQKDFFDLFERSIRNTTLVLLLPYSILWLYFSWKEKIEQLEKLATKEDDTITNVKKMLSFHDEKGALKFSVSLEDLLYLEASDNYVTIFYSDNDKNSKFLIRNTLKNYEQELQFPSLVRCHRSFMVNFERVKIIRKEKEGLLIDLNCEPSTSLPVSKTYVSNVIEAFSKYTS